MKRIVVCGGSGFIGRALVRRLVARSDSVTLLSRGGEGMGVAKRVTWNPYEPREWTKTLEGVDAVINLVGERAVGVRYTEETKQRIYDSRVLVARALAQVIVAAPVKPKLLLNVSAVGYYGDHPEPERIDESCAPGSDFLARLCVDWEAASEGVLASGVRLVNPRLGVVFGPDGGALEAMALPFKLFVGGKLGTGKQGVSWVHLDDVVSALLLCIDDETMPQKVNVCSPSPASNAEVSAAIGKALHRPSWLRAPSRGLKALLGEGAEAVLTGQFVVPRVLQAKGFQFQHSDVTEAVTSSL